MNGVFVLEPKDQIKERIRRSPDLADAYMQTHAYEDMPNDMQLRLRGQDHARRDFDPTCGRTSARMRGSSTGRQTLDADDYPLTRVRTSTTSRGVLRSWAAAICSSIYADK